MAIQGDVQSQECNNYTRRSLSGKMILIEGEIMIMNKNIVCGCDVGDFPILVTLYKLYINSN